MRLANSLKNLVWVCTVGLLFFSSCGKKAEEATVNDSTVVAAPEAPAPVADSTVAASTDSLEVSTNNSSNATHSGKGGVPKENKSASSTNRPTNSGIGGENKVASGLKTSKSQISKGIKPIDNETQNDTLLEEKKKVESDKLIISPNPVSSYFKVNKTINTLILTSNDGNSVTVSKLPDGRFYVGDLQNGIYYINSAVSETNEVFSGKLIIQR